MIVLTQINSANNTDDKIWIVSEYDRQVISLIFIRMYAVWLPDNVSYHLIFLMVLDFLNQTTPFKSGHYIFLPTKYWV